MKEYILKPIMTPATLTLTPTPDKPAVGRPVPPRQPLPTAVIDPGKPMLKLGLDVHLEFIMAVAQKDHANPHAPRKFTRPELAAQGSGYLKRVCDYVHLNPARAKLAAADAPLKSFAWSSWPAYLLAPSKRPEWLRVDRVLGEWGIPKDSPAGRQRLEEALEARRGAEEGEEFKPIRRGWCLGEEAFRKELLAQMSERLGAEHFGEERAETAEALAERIIAEDLKWQRWQEADLKAQSKGHSVKVALAVRLRAETTLTVQWIAERLGMGTRGHLNHLLYRKRKTGGK